MATIVVVHTGPVTVQPLKDQFAAQLPDVRMINIVDDSLLNDVRSAGHLTPEVTGRLYSYMSNAQSMGADFILNACSSVGEAVDTLRGMIRTPIIKIDETMAQEASRLGTRIGVVATVKTTLEPTVRLIRKKAAEAGREISVVERVAEEAFAALLAGDAARHDEVLKHTIVALADEVDVVVLAQVSMARLVPSLGQTRVPVLSSPQSGVATVKAALSDAH
ncbi:aspartate/glutamate racemase family protein [Paraburkholderia hospita]|uniref:Asp/Glu racemase n=1 Tax=Paraburkholderia hospita TaxID=169430 RepID=A0AAN1MNG4_9BURK|nr:aspartate/glutamate racemase family protein [Paraburkholderia hospita]AUT73464.1 Asp/Glu racemase [Paraburkholderia hospita]EIM98949.1 Asp/Glu/hydantoin racemase [Paraburkholderia hospita]OUL75210.1 Asp/Glu racemase [Paraburkholderia hospita]OUL94545.1 Asp/Glu racemase [Paraburkholderia hospita]SEH76785.1 Asp/Glu/Hydantoin racemase [Paraburkholderia hospita]